jgi:hypothetical protein
MPGLDPGIQTSGYIANYWIAGSSPAMTRELFSLGVDPYLVL